MEGAGVVATEPLPQSRGHRYSLTEAGKEFLPVIEGLGNWGQRWTVRVDPRHLDAAFPSWLMLSKFAGVPRPQRAIAPASAE